MESELFSGANRDVVLRRVRSALPGKKIVKLVKQKSKYNIWYTLKTTGGIKRGVITLAAKSMSQAKKAVKNRLPKGAVIDHKGSCVDSVQYLVYYGNMRSKKK